MNGKTNPGFEESDTDEPVMVTAIKQEVIHADTDEHILSALYRKHETIVNASIKILLVIAYHAYFIYCIVRHMKYDIPIWSCEKDCSDSTTPFWCDSLAFLIILTALAWAGVIYGYILKPLLGEWVTTSTQSIRDTISNMLEKRYVQILVYILVIGAFIAFMVVQAVGDNPRFISLAGYFILIFIGWMGSVYPGRVRWRQVTWGLAIQFVFALIVLKWPFGKDLVACLSSKVETFLGFADIGSDMVYGYLVNGKIFAPTNFNDTTGEIQDNDLVQSIRVILNAINESGAIASSGMMFKVLSLIYFLSFFVSMLYYLGVLQFVVLKLGWLLSVSVGSTAAESMNAAANIFLGQTEAPLLIKPFLPIMTKSEIHAIMTGGFATIAGSVLGAYIGMGIDPNELLTASFMAAPTALAVSKLFYPETEQSKTTVNDLKVERGEDVNVLDAAAKGASAAIMLVLNIAASLIAFKAFIGFLDAVVAWMGMFAGEPDLSFQMILGYFFWPLAWILGVRADDCEVVGQLIGMKLLITEFPAFGELGRIKGECEIEGNPECTLEPRSITICTFALCGFANFASVGMQIGGLSSLAPERKSDFAQLVLRAMIAGCWVSFLNACIAGVLV